MYSSWAREQKILWLLSDLKIKSSEAHRTKGWSLRPPVTGDSLNDLAGSQFKARTNLFLLAWSGFANPCQGFEQRRLLINFIIDSIRCFLFSYDA